MFLTLSAQRAHKRKMQYPWARSNKIHVYSLAADTTETGYAEIKRIRKDDQKSNYFWLFLMDFHCLLGAPGKVTHPDANLL